MRFLSLIALVIGSQIGSGALSCPAVFAGFGYKSMYAWLIAGIGAISLAYVFAQLCFMMPRTGGPYVYATEAFGKRIGFFTGWVYWFVSWISTVVVLIACVNYLGRALGIENKLYLTLLGLIIWTWVNRLNLKGVHESGNVEIVLTALKVLFFAVFIIVPLWFFDSGNIKPYKVDWSFMSAISAALWGFIGIETATTPADSVEEKSAIPKSVILGTCIVAVIYALANIAAIGSVEHSLLAGSLSPYDLIAIKVFGSSTITNLMAFILCLGSLNAWVLASSQIAYGLGRDGFLPKPFALLKNDTPWIGILSSGFGVAAIWTIGMSLGWLEQISSVIDALTPGFVMVYLICSAALWKLSNSKTHRFASLIGSMFCILLLACSDWVSALIICLLLATGAIYWSRIRSRTV